MKTLQSLGKSLTRDEQKRVTGGCLIPNGVCNCALVGQSCAVKTCCVYPDPVRCFSNTCVYV